MLRDRVIPHSLATWTNPPIEHARSKRDINEKRRNAVIRRYYYCITGLLSRGDDAHVEFANLLLRRTEPFT